MNPYYTTYFCGFPESILSEERYEEAIDCGFNLLQIEHGTTAQKQEALRFCERKGVRGIVHDPRIRDLVYPKEDRPEDPDACERAVREISADYRDYPARWWKGCSDTAQTIRTKPSPSSRRSRRRGKRRASGRGTSNSPIRGPA